MPQGIPQFKAAGDLLQVGQSGAFEPAGFALAGAYTFVAAQTIDLGSGALPSALSSTSLRLARIDGEQPRVEAWGFGVGSLNISGRVVGGTRAAQAATPAGAGFFVLAGFGYDTALTTTPSIRMSFTSDGLWSASNRGTYYTFEATLNGATSISEWLRLYRGQVIAMNGGYTHSGSYQYDAFLANGITNATTGQQVSAFNCTVTSTSASGTTNTYGFISTANLNTTNASATVKGFHVNAVAAAGATGTIMGCTTQVTAVSGIGTATCLQQTAAGFSGVIDGIWQTNSGGIAYRYGFLTGSGQDYTGAIISLAAPSTATNAIELLNSTRSSILLAVDKSGNLKLSTAGVGMYVKEGTNATMGVATLVAGTSTVSTTKVTASSRIFLSVQSQGGTAGFVEVTARVAGTSFTITSSSAIDTSVVAWLIIEPA